MQNNNIISKKEFVNKFDSKKSTSEILASFNCLNDDCSKLSDTEPFKYSSYNFIECSRDEQNEFLNDELVGLEFLVCDSIKQRTGQPYVWGAIYGLQHNPEYRDVEKTERKVLFGTALPDRPIGDAAWMAWNGLQVMDLDIKDERIAAELHDFISDDLKNYYWFLGLAFSASHKGLHIYTKINPITIDIEKRKIEYLCNFRHKYSFVYAVLRKYMTRLGYTKDDIVKWLDFATCKPQQGLFIGYDENSFLNTNFRNCRLDVNFEQAFDDGIESINIISHPDLRQIFAKLEFFSNDTFSASNNINKNDIAELGERDMSKNTTGYHYKHQQRWQLANTLAALFDKDTALNYLCDICPETSRHELLGDITTATRHSKPISVWAVGQLNKYHGFDIKLNDSVSDDIVDKVIDKSNMIPDVGLINSVDDGIVKLHIKNNQYLSDIKDDILSNLDPITLIEAGAGYGKTEMIKAFKSKTLLILPFTSTIKSKVEQSETTTDWLYYYGNKKPTMDELCGPKSMSMTIDKFSRLNLEDLVIAGFRYIVLDESHLIFTSSYRSVMSPTLQRLANISYVAGNNKCRVILMTGTPTGEKLFFPSIKHIKVEKDDMRIKDFELHFSPTDNETVINMAKCIAQDIYAGKKILYPTNQGNTHYDIMSGLIQKELNGLGFSRPLNKFYYKKSNFGEESMDDINFKKTMGMNDIIFCTSYLSVGVDICDKGEFCVYFDRTWISQDIEQFANRLRGTNLYIKIFLPKRDSNDNIINYDIVHPLDLRFSELDLVKLRDIRLLANDVIERNNEESKYNPITSGELNNVRCFSYDENTCRYYLDEITYKLMMYEDRYKKYATQLNVLLLEIKKYGYTIGKINHDTEIDDAVKEDLDEYIKSCRNTRFNYITRNTMSLLDHINENNIDMYKEIQKGNYDLIRSKREDYEAMRKNGNIYTDDIEVLEKNIPTILSLYKYYEIETIKDIYKFCLDTKTDRINFSKLARIRRFAGIVSSIKKGRLDLPVYKFIQDSKKWALDNPQTTKNDIDNFLKNYACTYANTIKDVVIEDNSFLTDIYELMCELWKIVVVQSNPKSGVISIHPFELMWDFKGNRTGDVMLTNDMKAFFDELTETKEEPQETESMTIPIDIELPELERTSKVRLEDVRNELPDIMSSEFDYFEFSNHGGSNERFLDKQKRTSQYRAGMISYNGETSYLDLDVKTEDTLFD